MSAVLIALLGIIGGALTTGAVQTYLDRRDRARLGRVSAAILRAELLTVISVIGSTLKRSALAPVGAVIDWRGFDQTWREHRVPVADASCTPS